MTAQVASSDTGMVTLGMMVARSRRRNRKITSTTSAMLIAIVNLDVVDRGADRLGAVAEHPQLDRRRQQPREVRQRVLHALDGLIDVVSGLLVHIDHDRALAVEPRRLADVLDAGDGAAEIARPAPARRCDRRRSRS